MAIRKFIEEIGEKILPPPRRIHSHAAASQQQQSSGAAHAGQLGAACYSIGLEINESAEAIRRHILSRQGHTAPSDLVIVFDEDDGRVILGGTVRDDETRERIVQTAGDIQGVEKVDDRMTTPAAARPRHA